MESAVQLAYEVRIYARVPDMGDGKDRNPLPTSTPSGNSGSSGDNGRSGNSNKSKRNSPALASHAQRLSAVTQGTRALAARRPRRTLTVRMLGHFPHRHVRILVERSARAPPLVRPEDPQGLDTENRASMSCCSSSYIKRLRTSTSYLPMLPLFSRLEMGTLDSSTRRGSSGALELR
jgi:hypothetical protein